VGSKVIDEGEGKWKKEGRNGFDEHQKSKIRHGKPKTATIMEKQHQITLAVL
jgi:hypothetical protein